MSFLKKYFSICNLCDKMGVGIVYILMIGLRKQMKG